MSALLRQLNYMLQNGPKRLNLVRCEDITYDFGYGALQGCGKAFNTRLEWAQHLVGEDHGVPLLSLVQKEVANEASLQAYLTDVARETQCSLISVTGDRVAASISRMYRCHFHQTAGHRASLENGKVRLSKKHAKCPFFVKIDKGRNGVFTVGVTWLCICMQDWNKLVYVRFGRSINTAMPQTLLTLHSRLLRRTRLLSLPPCK